MHRTPHRLILIPFFLLITLQYTPIFTDIATTTTLQNHLDTTTTQTTITLPATIYTQPLTISTPLTLRGIPQETTLNVTSSTNSYALHITTSNVIVQNLIIENHGPGLYTTGIKITAPQVKILNCTIRNTPVGIAIWSNNVYIENCTFENCEDEGIALLGSPTRQIYGTIIKNCTFIDNCDGIELQNAINTTIQDCFFTKQTHAAIDAIGSYNSDTTIHACEMLSNTVFDIYLANTLNTTISESVYTPDKLYQYKATNTKIVQKTIEKSQTESLPIRFSAKQYYSQLLARIQERITYILERVSTLKNSLYEKI